jgi:hypothetical protein
VTKVIFTCELIHLNKSLSSNQSSQPLRSHGGRELGIVLLNHGRAIAHLLAEGVNVYLPP